MTSDPISKSIEKVVEEPLTTERLLNERYRLLEPLGQGGMGTVYRAEHVRLHAIVAIKEIRGLSMMSGDEDRLRQELARCEHEAHFLVRLNHPNLPKVTDAFVEQDAFYLVMEYIQGVTLDARLQDAEGRPLDVLQTVEWGLQIVEVLTYLHAQDPPIIFRDLKPSNVMVTREGAIKLIDFGIARHFQPGASKDTSLLGSVGYSPPEQFGKGQTDPRSDVYAFGATMHHLLTGRDPSLTPFKFPQAMALNGQVPAPLSHLLDMCLALEPSDRPQSANVVAIQLLAVRDELVAQRARVASLYPANGSVGTVSNSAARSPGGSGSGNMGDGLRAGRSKGSDGLLPAGGVRKPSARVVPAQVEVDEPILSGKAWAIGSLLLLLIGGGIAIAVYSGRRSVPDKGHVTIVTSAMPVETVFGSGAVTNPLTSKEPTDGTSGSMAGSDPAKVVPDIVTSSDVSLQTALLAVTNEMLPIVVSGSVHGMAGKDLLLSVYFFDAKGSPLECADKNLPYFNEQNYLCSFARLNITSDDYTVNQTLGVPIRLLSGLQRPQPYSYQAMLFGSGKVLPIYKAPMVALPSSLIDPTPVVPSTSGPTNSSPEGALLRRGGG